MNKLLIIPLIIIFTIFGFYGGIVYKDTQAKKTVKNSTQTEKPVVNLMIDFGDGKIKTYNNNVINNNETVFLVLEKISKENRLNLKVKDYGSGMGAFIEEIDGYANDYGKNKYWQFWVDAEYAKIGAGGYMLRGGEVVEWKFVKGQTE